MSVSAIFQLPSCSKSGRKVCGGAGWGGEQVANMSNSNNSCFRVAWSWVTLGFDNNGILLLAEASDLKIPFKTHNKNTHFELFHSNFIRQNCLKITQAFNKKKIWNSKCLRFPLRGGGVQAYSEIQFNFIFCNYANYIWMLPLNNLSRHFLWRILSLLFFQNYSTSLPKKANDQLKLKGSLKKYIKI